MALARDKKAIITIAIIIFSILFLGQFVLAATLDSITAEDKNIATDLSAFSGLSADTILDIYRVVDDWHVVEKNIFIYKNLFSIASGNQKVVSAILNQLNKYSASDLLSVYEYLANNKLDYLKAESILQQYAEGTDLSVLLSSVLAEKTYTVYKPATEEQIRGWLSDGYLPEDILNADAIATAKDLDLSYVLSLKTFDVTWEMIGTKLGYVFPASESVEVSISIEKDGKKYALKGKDYDALVSEANITADTREAQFSEQLKKKYSLTAEDITGYTKRGFNLNEVENAFKLAAGSKAKSDEILEQKESGKSWEDIITQYSPEEGGTN